MQLQRDRVVFADDIPVAELMYDTPNVPNCLPLLDPKHEPRRRKGYGQDIECRRGKGHWTMNGDAITVRYEQLIRRSDARGRLLPLSRRVGAVRLVPKAGKLQAVSGKVPDGFGV
jgi:hypothetical protein